MTGRHHLRRQRRRHLLGRGRVLEAAHLRLPAVQLTVVLGLVAVHEADLPPVGYGGGGYGGMWAVRPRHARSFNLPYLYVLLDGVYGHHYAVFTSHIVHLTPF